MDKSNLIVNYLQTIVNEDDLNLLFSEFGRIQSLKIVRDKGTGISMGFGFVNFESNEAATKAAETLNGLELHGKRIKVSVARPAWKANIHSNLYIANLPTGYTESDVLQLVGDGLAIHVEHVRMLKNSEMQAAAIANGTASAASTAAAAVASSSDRNGGPVNEFKGVAVARFDTEESAMIALEYINTLTVISASTNQRCPIHAKPWRPEFRPERASSGGVVLPSRPHANSSHSGNNLSYPRRGSSVDDSSSQSFLNTNALVGSSGSAYTSNVYTPMTTPTGSTTAILSSTTCPSSPEIPVASTCVPGGYYPNANYIGGQGKQPFSYPYGPPPFRYWPPHSSAGDRNGYGMQQVVSSNGPSHSSPITDHEESILMSSFEQCGAFPGSVQMHPDRTWGYVQFPSHHAAFAAVNALTGFNVNGKLLELEAGSSGGGHSNQESSIQF